MSEEKGINEYFSLARKLWSNTILTSSAADEQDESLLLSPTSEESQQTPSTIVENEEPSDIEHSVLSNICRSYNAFVPASITRKRQQSHLLRKLTNYRDQPINTPASDSACHSIRKISPRSLRLHQHPSTRVSSFPYAQSIELTTSKGNSVRKRESANSNSDFRDEVDDVKACGEPVERRHYRGHDDCMHIVRTYPLRTKQVGSIQSTKASAEKPTVLRRNTNSNPNAPSETGILHRSARMIKAASIDGDLSDTFSLKQNVRPSMDISSNRDDVQHSTPKAKHVAKGKTSRENSSNSMQLNPVTTMTSEPMIKQASVDDESLTRSVIPFAGRLMKAMSMNNFKRGTVSRESSINIDDDLSSSTKAKLGAKGRATSRESSSNSTKLNPVTTMTREPITKAVSMDDEFYFTSTFKQLSSRPIAPKENYSKAMKKLNMMKAVSMDEELCSTPRSQTNIRQRISSLKTTSNYPKLKTVSMAPSESNIASIKEEDIAHGRSSSSERYQGARRPWSKIMKHRAISKPEQQENILKYSPKLTRAPTLLNGRPVDELSILFQSDIFKIPSLYGRIKVIFQFFNDKNDFMVTVLKSSNIAPLQKGTLGVYAKVCLTPGEIQSKTGKRKHDNRNPLFYETFSFRITLSELLNMQMRIRLYNKPGTFSLSEPIGECSVPLHHYDLTAVSVIWQNLNKCKGQMVSSLCSTVLNYY